MKKANIDEQKLYELYVVQNKLQSEIADLFEVDRVTITRRIKKLGYKRLYQDPAWLSLMVEEGKTTPDMMALANCSNEAIRSNLRKNGLDIKDDVRYKHFRKYDADYDYFDSIDTEEKAYWLGFILADGSILKTPGKANTLRLQILLKSTDSPHIQKFLDAIGSNHPIKIDKVKLGDKVHEQARVRINGFKLCNDLMKHNVHPNKSLNERVATELREDLVPHYLRGYFDGDGCISIYDNNKGKKHYDFTVIGSRDIVYYFKEHLSDFFAGDPKVMEKNALYYLKVGGRVQVPKILDYLYKDATVYLDRKFEKYNQCIPPAAKI